MDLDEARACADLESGDADARRVAVTWLGNRGDAHYLETLIDALQDEDRIVRWRAAEALGKLGDVRALGPLAATQQEKRHENREVGAWALGQLRDIRAVPLLLHVYRDENEDHDVRSAAAQALMEIKAKLDEEGSEEK